MLTRFGDFIYRARWGVLLVALAVLIGAGIFGFSAFGQFKTVFSARSIANPRAPSSCLIVSSAEQVPM